MAKVKVRKDELDLVVETAKRAAKRTNSVVVVAEDRLDLAVDDSGCQVVTSPDTNAVVFFH